MATRARKARSVGSELPATYREFVKRFPKLADANEAVAAAVEEAGPLDEKARALVKIGICTGQGLDTALRTHVLRALRAGATPAEVEQAVLLAINTIGFPATMAAWKRAREEIGRARRTRAPRPSGRR